MTFLQRVLLTTVANGVFATPSFGNDDYTRPFAAAVANIQAAADGRLASIEQGARPTGTRPRKWDVAPLTLQFHNDAARLVTVDASGVSFKVPF